MRRIRLSGVVVCQDNESTIGPVLNTLARVCDEIVVVDGGSRDGTAEIAGRHPLVRLFDHPFDGNLGRQKNYGFDRARGDWILSLDTDELLGERSLRWIPRLIRLRFAHWYAFPRYWLVERQGRTCYLADRPFYPDRTVRLFRNEPDFRYDLSRSPIHHPFPRTARRRFGLRLRRCHIFHYDFLLKSRAEREVKVERYLKVDPAGERIHRRYIWETWDVTLEEPREPLPGDLRLSDSVSVGAGVEGRLLRGGMSA